jgi:hypothetical protein
MKHLHQLEYLSIQHDFHALQINFVFWNPKIYIEEKKQNKPQNFQCFFGILKTKYSKNNLNKKTLVV